MAGGYYILHGQVQRSAGSTVCNTLGMAGILTILLLMLTAFGTACSTPQPTSAPPMPTPAAKPSAPSLETLQLERVLLPVAFNSPTNFEQDDDGQLLVSEQAGRVWIYDEEHLTAEHVFVPEPLDIRDRVSRRGSEEGLLGLAIDPNNRRHLFVYYSAANPRRSVVSRFNYRRTASPDSELVILEIEQPYPNHNGGQIAFGPDGYLYMGLGDGGSAGDPQGNGQDASTLLGSILRIDVSEATPDQPYAIPPDNPFADEGGRGEIWAYGLRNPWRFSFDRETGDLWTGDVGQNRWEEIDIIERGGNYGWNTLEANHCFCPSENCDRENKIPPVLKYSLDGQPCSVIGEYVYRGDNIPWPKGAYIYGDFCSGKIYGLRHTNGQVTEHKQLAATGMRIMSFAEDNEGELYLLSQREGIYRMAAGP